MALWRHCNCRRQCDVIAKNQYSVRFTVILIDVIYDRLSIQPMSKALSDRLILIDARRWETVWRHQLGLQLHDFFCRWDLLDSLIGRPFFPGVGGEGDPSMTSGFNWQLVIRFARSMAVENRYISICEKESYDIIITRKQHQCTNVRTVDHCSCIPPAKIKRQPMFDPTTEGRNFRHTDDQIADSSRNGPSIGEGGMKIIFELNNICS